jgi:DNA-binding MarR family transcriptional regulator
LGIIYINLRNGSKSIAASDLSNQLNITPAAITHILNPLEEAGFITRQKDPTDRRFVMIRLTDKGIKVGKSLLQDAHEVLEGLVQHLGEDNSRKLLVLITELLNYFSDYPIKQ